MSKISSSQPPSHLPSPAEARTREKEPDPSVAEAALPEGVMTLGEARQKEEQLREGFNPFELQAPWEDAHSEREEKLSRDALAQKNKKVEEKKAGARAGTQKGAQGQAVKPPTQEAAQGARRQPGGAVGGDGFEARAATRAEDPRLETPLAPAAPAPKASAQTGAIHVLNNAQDPGVYFREETSDDGRPSDETEDPELAAAVEECIRLLFGVRGIRRVGPGLNDKDEKVIVITPHKGFTQSSMRAIPERVHRFDTLVAIPYDLLPLRRDGL